MSTQAIAIWNAGNTFKTTISQNPALASNLSMVLPATAGTSGQALTTDGAGNLSWSTIAAGPSGGTLAISGGGTGLSTAPSTGQILLGSGTATWTLYGCSTNGHVLTWSTGTGFGCAAPSSQWTTGGTNISFSAGNVGIGVTAPGERLEVDGAVKIGSTATACGPAVEGAFRWNSTDKAVEVCNGTSWMRLTAVSGSGQQSTPSGSSGYFVVTAGTWNGNLGGLPGADAKCFSDLSANDWQGKADAVSRGLLTSSNVRAFISVGGTYSNGVASATYYFAVSGSPTSGGASMTMDSSGRGPANSQDWSGTNYFDGYKQYWSNRAGSSSTFGDGDGQNWSICSGWVNATGSGGTAISAATDGRRFHEMLSSCADGFRLLCWVHPTAAQSSTSFSFTNATSQPVGSLIASNVITVTGISGTQAVSVSGDGGPEIRVNGGAWTTASSMVSGQTLQVRLTSSASANTLRSATVLVGGSSATWQVTTAAGALKIFLTANGYAGSTLGGLAGADAVCQSEAGTAGYAGSYKALLSSSTASAASRLTLSYPIVNAFDGSTVASVNLWAGSLTGKVRTPSGGPQYGVWTGTDADGSALGTNCSDWTANTTGLSGNGDWTNSFWLNNLGSAIACNNAFALYCVQQ